MKNARKISALVVSLLMVVTLVLSAVFSLLGNAFTRRVDDSSTFGEVFAEGKYTSYLAIDEVDVGGIALINMLSENKFVSLVKKTQKYEAKIKECSESIRELEINSMDGNNSSYYESQIAKLKEERNEAREALESFLEGYTEEDFEILNEKFQDEKFINSIGLSYMITTGFGFFTESYSNSRGVISGFEVLDKDEEADDEANADNEDNKADEGETEEEETDGITSEEAALIAKTNRKYNSSAAPTLRMLAFIFGALTYALAIAVLIAGIILVINSIIKVIRLSKNFKDADEKLIDSLKTGPLTALTGMCFVLLAFVKIFAGSSVSIGAGVVFMGIAFVVDCIGTAYVKACDEGFAPRAISGVALSFVSAVLCVILIFTAFSCCVGAIVGDKIEKFENVSYYEVYNDKFAKLYNDTDFSGMTFNERSEKITDLRNETYRQVGEYFENSTVRYLIPVFASFLLAMFAVIAASCILCRMGGRTYKNKLGQVREYKAQYVSVVLALVCAIALPFFTVSDIDGIKETISTAKYSVAVSEYEIEGTYDYEEYEALEEQEDFLEELIEHSREEIADVTDEEELKDSLALIENFERELGYVENAKAELEETDLPIMTCIVLAVLLLVSEIAYSVVPGKLSATASVKPVVEETAATEAPAEEETAEEETAEEDSVTEETAAADESEPSRE